MKDKTYIKIFAGLGNQIFQYIYGLYNELHGKKVKYILSRTNNDIIDIFDLNNSKNIYAPQGLLKKFKIIIAKVWAKYVIRSFETDFFQEAKIVDEVNTAYSIPKLLQFKNEKQYLESNTYKEIIKSPISVSLHIRGGDYLTAQETYGGICTPTYYKKAIKYFMNKFEKCCFFVFTNDIEYSQKILFELQLPSNSFLIVQPTDMYYNDPGYDLYLMSKCQHNIIANSTFSWWGAYLNENENKIVLTPSKWTNDEKNTLEIIKPNDWISI